MAATLTDFWSQLANELLTIPDEYFLEEVMEYRFGPLRLDLFNVGDSTSGIPREFMLALVSAMMTYTSRGFCGTFNALVRSRGVENGRVSAGIKLWIILRFAP